MTELLLQALSSTNKNLTSEPSDVNAAQLSTVDDKRILAIAVLDPEHDASN